MSYKNPEQQRIAKRDSARRRRAAKRDSPVVVYVAGRHLMTEAGPVEPGGTVDVTSWSEDALRVALSTELLRVPPAPGRATYRAARRLRVADRIVEPGEAIIEANYWPNPGPWLRCGMIEPNPLAHLPA